MPGDYLYWAKSYSLLSKSGKHLKNFAEDKYFSIVRKYAGYAKGAALLEIGPGLGYFAQKAKDYGFDYSAIEKSPLLSEQLRKKNINVICADAVTISADIFGAKKFDVIYLSHILEHCDSRKDAESLIRNCRALLAKGGHLIINAPNVLSYKFDFWISDYSHNFVTTPLRVKNLLTDNGFTAVYEVRMVLGISNIVLRKLISFLFFVCPKIILNNVAKIFMPLGMGGFIIYGHENFTIVAEKFDQ